MSTSQDRRLDQAGPTDVRAGERGTVRAFIARTILEVTMVGALFALYNLGRLVIVGQEATARAHAEIVRRAEELLHLPSEAAIQEAVAAVPHIFEAANRYYVTLHFPVMIVFLVWGFVARPRADYAWARNLLVTMTFLGLALHMVFPLAPPRMFPEWGFTDTMAVWGPSAYEGATASVANQYAAMPSLHIGWALLIALVLIRTGPRLLAGLAVVHAALTVFVVVITANHWWLDGVVAAILLALAVLLFPRPATDRLVIRGRIRSQIHSHRPSPRHEELRS